MSAELPIGCVDVILHASRACNSRRVNECCLAATKRKVAELAGQGIVEVQSAELLLECPGYDDTRGGCQARVSGSFLDQAGNVLAQIITTAQEVAAEGVELLPEFAVLQQAPYDSFD